LGTTYLLVIVTRFMASILACPNVFEGIRCADIKLTDYVYFAYYVISDFFTGVIV